MSRLRVGCAVGAGAIVGAVLVGAALFFATLPDVEGLRSANPESTAFIDRYRERRAADPSLPALRWTPVPWSAISVHLKRAVVSAEDMEFFSHAGFSAFEIRQAVREALTGGRVRGASTITQQLAKNLWLSPSRNPLRKLKEVVLTGRLERVVGKRRILELYLNVVEFGPGVYGAEAAARRYFGSPATALTERQAAMLAAGLPRPSRWHPGVESESYARYVREILDRMARAMFLWRHLE